MLSFKILRNYSYFATFDSSGLLSVHKFDPCLNSCFQLFFLFYLIFSQFEIFVANVLDDLFPLTYTFSSENGVDTPQKDQDSCSVSTDGR